MMRGQPYTTCKIYYDGDAALEPGHYLRTPAGSVYLIHAVRQDRKRAYRRHLVCLRWPPAEIPAGASVHPMYWYPRQRRRGKPLGELRP